VTQKKVLLVSYYFPPLGGAGIGRPLAILRHLPEFGYECDVLTVKPVLYRVYEPELLDGLDRSKIFRSGSRDPSRLLYLLGFRSISAKTADKSRIISKMFFPDGKAGWIGPAIRLGKKLAGQNKYDLIISTSPPISAHVIAYEISRKLQIPWIADFTDFWTSYKAEDYFGSAQKALKARQLLAAIKNQSKLIVAVNESCREYVGANMVIPNCYDSQLAKLWTRSAEITTFTVGVFGTISELTPIEPLLKVLKLTQRKQKTLFEQTRVLQVGQVNADWLERQLREYSLQAFFEVQQFQSRATAIRLLSRAALFYVGISPAFGQGITPGRIFTLLASGRPILAYAPAGSEIDKLLKPAENCFCFQDSTIDQAGDFLIEQSQRFQSGQNLFTIVPDYAKEFSDVKMVEKFASIFNQMTSTE